MLFLYLLLSCVNGQFYGTWNVRLSNWNTGRAYMREINRAGLVLNEYLLFLKKTFIRKIIVKISNNNNFELLY